jgi:hypothetical protein
LLNETIKEVAHEFQALNLRHFAESQSLVVMMILVDVDEYGNPSDPVICQMVGHDVC